MVPAAVAVALVPVPAWVLVLVLVFVERDDRWRAESAQRPAQYSEQRQQAVPPGAADRSLPDSISSVHSALSVLLESVSMLQDVASLPLDAPDADRWRHPAKTDRVRGCR